MLLKDYISKTLIALGESYPFESDVELDIGVFVCRKVPREGEESEIICVDENSKNRVKFTVHIGPSLYKQNGVKQYDHNQKG